MNMMFISHTIFVSKVYLLQLFYFVDNGGTNMRYIIKQTYQTTPVYLRLQQQQSVTLTKKYSMNILPKHTNGIEFYGSSYLAAITSNGIDYSYLNIYKMNYSNSTTTSKASYELPSMGEEMARYSDTLIILYESASSTYEFTTATSATNTAIAIFITCSIDRAMKFSASTLFNFK